MPAVAYPDIYAYSDPIAYLVDLFEHRKKKNPAYSLRSWSRQMGLKSHATVLLLLKRQRKLKSRHAIYLANGTPLKGSRRRYFETLVFLESAETDAERRLHESTIRSLHPDKEKLTFLDAEKFKYISEWHHSAILEMSELGDFVPSAEWISARLGGLISELQAATAIRRLLKLGLIKKQGNTLRKTHQRLTNTTDPGTAKASINSHHKEVMRLAALSIDSQLPEDLHFNSCAMTIDRKRLPQAKELIWRFRADLSQLVEKQGGDETYQLGIQFFRLTQPNPSRVMRSPSSPKHDPATLKKLG